jgi:hypothetical protein
VDDDKADIELQGADEADQAEKRHEEEEESCCSAKKTQIVS